MPSNNRRWRLVIAGRLAHAVNAGLSDFGLSRSATTAIMGAILLGVGLVGFLFRRIGSMKRALFIMAAVTLLVPVVHAGRFVELTWAVNGVGLTLGVILVGVEWLGRSAQRKPEVVAITLDSGAA